MKEVQIYLKNGNVIKVHGETISAMDVLKHMGDKHDSVITLGKEGFVLCSEIAAVLEV